jgi:hypothetical protein
LVKAYNVCPSLTRQPTLARRSTSWERTTSPKPPPTWVSGQGVVAKRLGAGSPGCTATTQTGIVRPSGR